MSTLKVNELDTRSGTTITVAAGKTIAGTDIIDTTQIATDAITSTELADNAVGLTEMAGLARGSIIYGNASGDPAALTKGTADQVLKSDGTDIAWGADAGLPTQNAAAAGKNLVTDGSSASWNRESPNFIINGDFDVWQRGTTFNISGAGPGEFTADRWKFMGNNFTGSLTRNAFATNQTDVPDCPAYYVRWINNTTMTAGQKNQFLTPIELIPNGHKLANQEVTFSCWLRSAAGTIPDGNVTLIKESAVYPSVGAITTTWTKFTHTWTVWNSNQGYMWIGFECPATYALLGGIDIAHCQLELGGVATTFKSRSFGEELIACERYFQTYIGKKQEWYYIEGNSASYRWWQFYYRKMRTKPAITFAADMLGGSAGSVGGTVSALSATPSWTNASIRLTTSAAGGSANTIGHLDSFEDKVSSLDAEL